MQLVELLPPILAVTKFPDGAIIKRDGWPEFTWVNCSFIRSWNRLRPKLSLSRRTSIGRTNDKFPCVHRGETRWRWSNYRWKLSWEPDGPPTRPGIERMVDGLMRGRTYTVDRSIWFSSVLPPINSSSQLIVHAHKQLGNARHGPLLDHFERERERESWLYRAAVSVRRRIYPPAPV